MHGGMLQTYQVEFIFMTVFRSLPFSLFIKEVTQPVMHSFVGSMTSMLQPLTTRLQDELTIKKIE